VKLSSASQHKSTVLIHLERRPNSMSHPQIPTSGFYATDSYTV